MSSTLVIPQNCPSTRRKTYISKCKPSKSCPKNVKIHSVVIGKNTRVFSCSKHFKRTETVRSKNKFGRQFEPEETSLEKKLKYFYLPYNKQGDFSKFMRFEQEAAEFTPKPVNVCDIRQRRPSQWRKLSKVIMKEDEEIFKDMMKTINGRKLSHSSSGTPGKAPPNAFSFTKLKTLWKPRKSNIISEKEIDEISKLEDKTTPTTKLSSTKTNDFGTLFCSLKSIVRGSKYEKKKSKKRKVSCNRKPRILVSKFSNKLSLNKLMNPASGTVYSSSKNKKLVYLDSVREKSITPSSSRSRCSEETKPRVKQRLLSPVLKRLKSLEKDEDFKEAHDSCRNVLSLLASRPNCQSPQQQTELKRKVRPRLMQVKKKQLSVYSRSPKIRKAKLNKFKSAMNNSEKLCNISSPKVKVKPSTATLTTNFTNVKRRVPKKGRILSPKPRLFQRLQFT